MDGFSTSDELLVEASFFSREIGTEKEILPIFPYVTPSQPSPLPCLQGGDHIPLLPMALILYIFSFWDPREVLKCEQISKSWRQSLSSVEGELLWKQIYLHQGWGPVARSEIKLGHSSPEDLKSGTEKSYWRQNVRARLRVDQNWAEGKYTLFPLPHASRIRKIALSGDLLAVADCNQKVTIWNLAAHKTTPELINTLRCSDTHSMHLAGKYLVTGSIGGDLDVWNCELGPPSIFSSKHVDNISQVIFFDRLIIVASERKVKIFELDTGLCIHTILLNNYGKLVGLWAIDRHCHPIGSDPDMKLFVTAHDDRGARIWDTRTGEQISKSHIVIHPKIVDCDGKRILTTGGGSLSSGKEHFMVYDIGNLLYLYRSCGDSTLSTTLTISPDVFPSSLPLTSENMTDGVSCLRIHNHRAVAFIPTDARIYFWDLRSGKCVQRLIERSHIIDLAVETQRLVGLTGENVAWVWDFLKE